MPNGVMKKREDVLRALQLEYWGKITSNCEKLAVYEKNKPVISKTN